MSDRVNANRNGNGAPPVPRVEVAYVMEGGQGFVLITDYEALSTHVLKLPAKVAEGLGETIVAAATKAGLGLHLPPIGDLDL